MTFQHTKSCLAKSIICAVENFRDNEEIDINHFRAMIGGIDKALLDEADGYLNDGIATCYCIVSVAKRVMELIEGGDLQRAQGYATAELQCGTITTSQYLDLVKVSEGRLPEACIHPSLFAPTPFDINGTSRCHACQMDIWNGDL